MTSYVLNCLVVVDPGKALLLYPDTYLYLSSLFKIEKVFLAFLANNIVEKNFEFIIDKKCF